MKMHTSLSAEYPKWVNGRRVMGPSSVDLNDTALALTIDQFAEKYIQPALAKFEQQCDEFDKMMLDEYPALIDTAPIATPPPSPYDEPVRRKRGRPRKSK